MMQSCKDVLVSLDICLASLIWSCPMRRRRSRISVKSPLRAMANSWWQAAKRPFSAEKTVQREAGALERAKNTKTEAASFSFAPAAPRNAGRDRSSHQVFQFGG